MSANMHLLLQKHSADLTISLLRLHQITVSQVINIASSHTKVYLKATQKFNEEQSTKEKDNS